ncbi:MAG: hypothetical protein HY271_12045 [Deltaproteobacteria bacterium]|nr:hypothetical protein [Deltaproteobacteria bacterium]
MKRSLPALALAGTALFVYAVAGLGVSAPDHYLCYKAARAKGQPKFSKGATTALEDQLGGPLTFDVVKIAAICNPVDRDGSGVVHPDVHQEGFKIKVHEGGPKFVKSNHVTVDAFAQRTLTITAPVVLLDVAPQALGGTPPAVFGSDPTSDPTVNRFKCYKAKLAKGSPKFLPPASPSVVDAFFGIGRQFVVKNVTKLCEPVDEDGETPGAETRQTVLVCYAVKLAKGSPKFVKTTVATNDANVAPHILVVSAPAELCMPALEPTPTVTPTPTPTATAVTTPGKRVFVTSTATNGQIGGTFGADTICAERATAAGLLGTFKAWLSVTGDGPSTRFTQSATPYGLVNGTIIANDWNDLTDGTLAHAINVDESGNAVTFGEAWTATDAAGAPKATNCSNFLNNTSSVSGVCGSTAQTNAGWTESSTPTCDTQLRLYCFER